jgi:SAM-dependent methyltransferase
MNRREILGTLRSLARARQSFLASQLEDPEGRPPTAAEIRRITPADLGELGLLAVEEGDDLRLSRLPPGHPYVPPPGALRSLAGFLGHPVLPDRLQELIEAYIGKKTGKPWNDPVVLDRIRAAIRAQKEEYWDQARGRPISYRAGYTVFAYLAYQAPVVFVQVEHLLHDLAEDGLLTDRMRVLDIGSGPGTVPLAITDAWNRLSPGRVRISSLEQETENLEAYRSLVPAFASGSPSVSIAEPLQGDLRSLDPDDLPGEVDLLFFANVLNELRELGTGERAALVERCAAVLAEGGTVIVMEPADLENSVALRKISAELIGKGLSLFAPCTTLWSGPCRPDRCWSFREEPPMAPPRLMGLLASSTDGYRYLNTDIKFSYALFRGDRRTRAGFRVPRGMKALPLSKIQGHLKHRVNVVVAKMSGDLGGGRGDLVFKVCDGTPQKPVFAVVPAYHAGRARALVEGRYGEIVSLEHVLVRFNPARDAFNLFVDRSATVEGIRAPEGARPEPSRERRPARRRPRQEGIGDA